MKNVLITNLYLERYTGSEFHVLEIGHFFESKGYRVTIAVLRKGYPLLGEAGSIQVIDCYQEELPETEYDIIFAQHFAVLDYLRCKYELHCRKLIVSKLSILDNMEALPECVGLADLIICVNEKCAEVVQEELGDSYKGKIRVLENSAGEEFFQAYREDRFGTGHILLKIGVVSNHVTEELKTIASPATDTPWQVDYIGLEYYPVLMQPSLLEKYDLIITIGRTVQQCMAMGIPVYVYDRFGGPGYLDESNMKLTRYHNFSGRGFREKTTEEICAEICGGYAENLERLKSFHLLAEQEFSQKENMEAVFKDVFQEGQGTGHRLTWTGAVKQRMEIYGSGIASRFVGFRSQLYYDCGKGLNEEDSVSWNGADNYEIKKTVYIDKPIKALRFDPGDRPCTCVLKSFLVNGKEYVHSLGSDHVFYDHDPQVYLELDPSETETGDDSEVCIIYKVFSFSDKETIGSLNYILTQEQRREKNWKEERDKLEQEIYRLNSENETLDRALKGLYDSMSWKITRPLRKARRWLKGKPES